MLESFVFGNLSGLFLGLLAPLLVLAYLQRTPLKRKIVSSLMILKLVPKAPSLKRRIKLPWRFFFELLLLLLLIGAAAMPFYRDRAARVAILLDNSLSMRAVSSEHKGTRFDEAIEGVRSWVGLQSSRSLYSLFTVAPKLRRVGDERISADAVVSLLNTVSPTFAADTLEGAVDELVSTGSFDKILVISDQEKEKDQTLIDGGPEIETIVVGKLTGNVALTNLRIERRGLEERVLIAAIGGSGIKATPVRVRVSIEEKNRLLAEVRAQAVADKVIEVPLTLPPGLPPQTLLHVTLESTVRDALAEDDQGWISSEAQGATTVLVVSPENPGPDAFGLRKIEGLQLEVVTPFQFSELPPNARSRYSLIIFHHASAPALPRVPTLVILPPAANTLFPIKREAENPVLSSFRAEHPITSYLRLELLKIPSAVVFEVPAWAQSVINVEQGTVVMAGESQGLRFAAVGMELFPFEGASTPTASILLLNLFSWLSGGSEFAQSYLTGSSIRLEENLRWQVEGPNEEAQQREQKPGSDSFLLERPGIYRFTAEGTRKVIPVNAFHPEESATAFRREYRVERGDVQKQESTDEDQPLWPMLLQAIVFFLAADLLVLIFLRRRDETRFQESVA